MAHSLGVVLIFSQKDYIDNTEMGERGLKNSCSSQVSGNLAKSLNKFVNDFCSR